MTVINLITKGGVMKPHGREHALSLLRWQVQNGRKDWTIHKDEPYEFIENEIIRKRSTRNSKAKKGK